MHDWQLMLHTWFGMSDLTDVRFYIFRVLTMNIACLLWCNAVPPFQRSLLPVPSWQMNKCIHPPCWCSQQVPLKWWYISTKPHSTIPQKMVMWINSFHKSLMFIISGHYNPILHRRRKDSVWLDTCCAN